MIKVHLSELELDDLGEDIWTDLQPRAQAALDKGVDLIVRRAKEKLSRRGTAQTSAPAGTPPEYDEGELHDSIRAFGTRRTKYSIRKEYGSTHPAAGLHEFGGLAGGKRRYPPRPYMRPAEAETEPEVERILDSL